MFININITSKIHQNPQHKNIILIYFVDVDQITYNCLGNTIYSTPNLSLTINRVDSENGTERNNLIIIFRSNLNVAYGFKQESGIFTHNASFKKKTT